jgi:S-adenosyl-L-methionine hydrolase (adenosine-forming)
LPVKIITLTSDFGLKDPYAAEIKAAILNIAPDALLVDVTHEVEKFNIREGAYVLASAAPYFPEGTIHLAVVDPSVGTQRRPLIVQTKRGFFVGPDNGLLVLAAEAQGIKHMHEITTRRLMLPHVSNTFHGRDIFAPAAAHLANGVPLEEFGPQVTEITKPEFTKIKRDKGAISGEVLHVDGFGNIITNIHARDLHEFSQGMLEVEFPSCKLELKLMKIYAEAKPREYLALIGSHSYLEIATNQGNAAVALQVKAGTRITLSTT